jgi:6-phosphofructokinase 1
MDEKGAFLKDVPRDEHGHVRLAEIPIARLLRTAVTESLEARGVKVAIGEKDVGYELRCAPPGAFDREYTHDLGVGAVTALLAGVSDALITRQAGGIVPIPFADIIDARSGRSRVREVDVRGDAWRSALALQDRVGPEDLGDPQRLARIAAAARLTPEQASQRYAGTFFTS